MQVKREYAPILINNYFICVVYGGSTYTTTAISDSIEGPASKILHAEPHYTLAPARPGPQISQHLSPLDLHPVIHPFLSRLLVLTHVGWLK
jgi:hypothetical protein